jgi:hypothetical protein
MHAVQKSRGLTIRIATAKLSRHMDALMAAVAELAHVSSPRAHTKSAATPITKGQAAQRIRKVTAVLSQDMDALVAAVDELGPGPHELKSRWTCRPSGRSY